MTEDEAKRAALEEFAEECEISYEALTAEYGAYGQMKLRAAYRLAAKLAKKKAKTYATH